MAFCYLIASAILRGAASEIPPTSLFTKKLLSFIIMEHIFQGFDAGHGAIYAPYSERGKVKAPTAAISGSITRHAFRLKITPPTRVDGDPETIPVSRDDSRPLPRAERYPHGIERPYCGYEFGWYRERDASFAPCGRDVFIFSPKKLCFSGDPNDRRRQTCCISP